MLDIYLRASASPPSRQDYAFLQPGIGLVAFISDAAEHPDAYPYERRRAMERLSRTAGDPRR